MSGRTRDTRTFHRGKAHGQIRTVRDKVTLAVTERREFQSKSTTQKGDTVKRLAILLCSCVPGLVLGQTNCDKPRNDFDGLYCLNKVYLQADKDLNDSYSELTSLLDEKGRGQLKKGQVAWIKSRNANCSYRDAKDEFYVNMDCATKTTIERTEFLNDRKRECVSAGCMNSKLE
jgi:uncharacterized protein YecT (DUF1311 family)